MNNPMEKNGYKILVESGLVPKAQLEKIFRESEVSDASFSQLLVKSGLLKESEMLDTYSKSLGISTINLKAAAFDKKILEKVPVKFASYYKFFPIKLHNRKLTI